MRPDLDELLERWARRLEQLRGLDLCGTEWSAPGVYFWGVLSPSLKRPGKLRLSLFDEHGFSGHTEPADAARELLSYFGARVEPWPGALDYLGAGWPEVSP